MHRRSIYLTPTLNFRLEAASKEESKSVSAFVSDLLNGVLVAREQRKLVDVYSGLKHIQGIGKKGDTTASTAIDEVLYGDDGAWRGSDR